MTVTAIPEARPGPVSPSDRIEAIDALRGIALFGVLAINLVTEFRVSIFEQFFTGRPASPIDHAVETVLRLAVDMKAFALFSLLFGVGLAIQFDRLEANPRRGVLLVRRLLVLLAIGLMHLVLIWNGDILTEYAVAGFLVLPFLFGPRRLLAFAAAAFLALYLALPLFVPDSLFPSMAAMTQDIAAAYRIYGSGGLVDVLMFRIRELPLFFPLHVYVFPRTVGLFLLGALAWRAGILRNAATHEKALAVVAAAGIGLGAALTLLAANGFFTARSSYAMAGQLGTILLALGYGAAVIRAFSSEVDTGSRQENASNQESRAPFRFYRNGKGSSTSSLPVGEALFGWAAPLGRMAFTNYLAQSIIFGWIFYGYGLGLFGRLGAASALAIGLAVYIAQVICSAWWLRRYRYGPVEWLWRTLMYGASQSMR